MDSNGTGANNFASLADAVTSLATCGVSGPVTITLAGYAHTGGLSLGQIPGASATNTVTFQGASAGGSVLSGVLGLAIALFRRASRH